MAGSRSLCAVAIAFAACSGQIAVPNTEGRGTADEGGGQGQGSVKPPAAQPECQNFDVGPTPLRRLTRSQYNNTIAELLGDASRPADSFPPDETLLGFDAGVGVSTLLADHYVTASEALSKRATENMARLLSCDPAAKGEDVCAHAFIDDFVSRAYRRPLQGEERGDLRALYSDARARWGFRTAIELVIQAVLQSPQFIYRIETGKPTAVDGVVELQPHELASRLSYLLWNSMPDRALFDAAARGGLDSPAGIQAEVRRMLSDDRVRTTVRSFVEQWLHLGQLEFTGKDDKLFPQFDNKLREAMKAETLAFAEHVILDGDGSLATMLTADFSFVNERLAGLYGLSEVTGEAMIRQDLPACQRHGLLTHPALLAMNAKANQSSPVHRGVFVRERLLCQALPPPPPDVVVEAPDPDPNLPTRERFKQHSTDPACAGCHRLIDPIGFGFEHYDAIGRYREMDGGHPVDARGEIVDTSDIDGPFEGVGDLAARLSASADVSACMAGQWFVYAFGRSGSNQRDICSMDRLINAFEKGNLDIRELVVALTATDAFRFTRVSGASATEDR